VLQYFLAFLGGEPGEEKPMLLLLGKGFCMGIFVATYTVGAETLFLTTVGAEYLDIAFFMAGAAGIVTTAIYVQVQRTANFSTLVLSNAFLILLFVVAIRSAFTFLDYDSWQGHEFHYLPFILFVMIGPVMAISLLGFWGIFGRVFDLKQAKRIIGGIDTGQLTATMIGFFSIPVLTRTIIDSTYDLLIVSGIASFGVLVFTIWIVKNFNLDTVAKIKKTDNVKTVSYLDLFKNKYLRLLCLFMIFSMGSAVFIEYVYLSATEIMYPNENELRDFLSFTSGAVMVLSFIIQSFINDIIIGKFGLKVSLMVMPLILAIFTMGAIFSGHMFVYDIKTEEYLFFFIFMVVGKVFTSSLKDALENPAFKLFFLTFDVKIRFDIQSRVEGVVNELGKLGAGALQIGMGVFALPLLGYSYFIMVLAGIIVFYASKLFAEYKVALKKTMEDQKNKLKGAGSRNEENTVNVIKTELRKQDPKRQLNALKLMERMEPILLDFSLLDFIRSENKTLRAYAFKRLCDLKSFNTLEILEREVKKEDDADVKKMAIYTIKDLNAIKNYELTEIGIKKLVRSTDIKDRIYAARTLAKMEEDKFVPFLTELLRDINPKVRNAAIITAGKLKRPEFWSILIENLHIPAYSNAADSALISAGESMLQAVDSAFYKTGQHEDTMVRIVQILGKVGGRSAVELLWKKIDFPSKAIVSELLLSLSYIGFEAKDFQAARIKIAVERSIGDVAWNIKALLEIPREDYFDKMIIAAFDEENKKNLEHIFTLLAMNYDSQSIKLVRDNIELGTTDSVSFALEMLDIFVDEDLKPKLKAVLDDTEPVDKLKQLSDFFPPENFVDYSDLLLQIINRDYNNVNKWTKCLAMYKLTLVSGQKITIDLIANLFNPDPVLIQTSAAVMYKLDKEEYQTHTRRLKPSLKKKLDKAIVPPVFKSEDEKFHQKLLVIERAVMLKQIYLFESIPGVLILELASLFDEIMVEAGVDIIQQGDTGSTPLYIVLKGKIKAYNERGDVIMIGEKGIFGQKLILESDINRYTLVTETETTLLVLGKNELYDMVSKHIEMVEGILTIVNDKVKQKQTEDIFN